MFDVFTGISCSILPAFSPEESLPFMFLLIYGLFPEYRISKFITVIYYNTEKKKFQYILMFLVRTDL